MVPLWFHFLLCVFALLDWDMTSILPMLPDNACSMHAVWVFSRYALSIACKIKILISVFHFIILIILAFLCGEFPMFFFFLLLTWWCLDDDSFQGTPGNGSEVDHENGSALWGGTFWLLFPKQNTRRISDITFFYLVLIKHVNHECFSEAKMLAKWWMGFSHLWKSTTYFEYCRNV